MFDLFDKLKQASQVAEDSKAKLELIDVTGTAGNEDITVVITAAKTPKNVIISDALFSRGDKEEIEDLFLVALKNALHKAEQIADQEMKSGLGDLLGGFPGL